MKFRMIQMIVILLMLGVGLPMMLPGPNGRPIMSWKDWVPDGKQMSSVVGGVKEIAYQASEMVETKAGVSVGPDRPKLYKWRDAQGNWHFSDKATDTAANQLVSEMPQARNTMTPPAKIDFGRDEESGSKPSMTSIPLPTTVPVANIPKLIEDAKNVQKLADQRAEQISNY